MSAKKKCEKRVAFPFALVDMYLMHVFLLLWIDRYCESEGAVNDFMGLLG